MLFRRFLLLASVVSLSACATPHQQADVGEVEVDERQAITAGPLDEPGLGGTEVMDRTLLDGPTPGTQQDLVVNVGDRVFFGFDRFDLTSEARQILMLQADWLREYPAARISIEGHCDERGTREYNLALGEKRANAVKSYLVALGIDEGRISTISYGKERPAALGSNAESWAQNRRGVTIVE